MIVSPYVCFGGSFYFLFFFSFFSGVPKFLVFFKSFHEFLFLSLSSLIHSRYQINYSIQFRTDFVDIFRACINLQLYPFSKEKIKTRGGSEPNPFDFFILFVFILLKNGRIVILYVLHQKQN